MLSAGSGRIHEVGSDRRDRPRRRAGTRFGARSSSPSSTAGPCCSTVDAANAAGELDRVVVVLATSDRVRDALDPGRARSSRRGWEDASRRRCARLRGDDAADAASCCSRSARRARRGRAVVARARRAASARPTPARPAPRVMERLFSSCRLRGEPARMSSAISGERSRWSIRAATWTRRSSREVRR